MRDSTRLGLLALAAAAVLGVLGDLLLRVPTWGLNAPAWLALLVIAVAALAPLAKLRALGDARWLALVALFFAACIALRDSPVIVTVNVLAVLLTLGLAAHRARTGWPRIGGLVDYIVAYFSAGFHALGGVMVLVVSDVKWGDVPRTGWPRVVLSVLRGLLIAIPLLLLFGALFMAADAVFSGLVGSIFAVNIQDIVAHAFWMGVWAWLTAGFLRQVLFGTTGLLASSGASVSPALAALPAEPAPTADDPSAEPAEPTTRPAPARVPRTDGRAGLLGTVELGIVLGLLDLLFLAFVVVQFRYLFGGAELVQVSPTLTYAEYARRGFFELVAVGALLLPIMLTIDWLAKLDRARDVRLYRALAGALIVLLFVVIASAVFRMRLYAEEFGLTELRLYTTAFMGWIALVALWYLATVLRERRDRFMFGAFVGGLLIAVVLNGLNPDDLIVRTNTAHAEAIGRFDGVYASGLSADAVPAVIDALPLMPADQRRSAANRLLRLWRPPETVDWRSWRYSRWRAWEAVSSNEAMLREVAGWPPTGEPPPTRSSDRRGGDWLDVPGPSD